MPVPSKATRVGSFCDLKRKKTDEVMATGHLAIGTGGSEAVKRSVDICCELVPTATKAESR